MRKVSTTTGDGVARAFVRSQAALFGSYRHALHIEPVSTTETVTDVTLIQLAKRTTIRIIIIHFIYGRLSEHSRTSYKTKFKNKQ